jgi:prepilin-type N-terminal cleavage/methylation domain-containing protein
VIRPPSTRAGLSARPNNFRAFTLLEILVVMAIIAILLVALIPNIAGLQKSAGTKGAVSNVMNAMEQARSLALTSGSATYVVFADQTTPTDYRCRAYIIFKEDKNFNVVAVTKWNYLPTGVSFRPSTGLLTAQSGASPVTFVCPGQGFGSNPIPLPYIKFDSTGMVAYPTPTSPPAPSIGLFADMFSGTVDGNGQMAYTDQTQKTNQKFDSVVIARFTGRARYVNPYG